ncbi:MAG: glycosyltransferase [Candidatus Fimenecus sp.]
MKKVLIFAPTAPSSGITQYVLNILGKIDSEGISFDILSFRNDRLKKWAEEHGGEYFEFDISMYKHPVLYRKFLKNVFSRGYDVVHYNISTISTLLIFKYAKKYSNARLIVHSHACSIESQSRLRYIVFDNVHKLLRVFANRYSDCKCACSVLAAEWMYGKKAAKNAIILNNAVDIEKFAYSESDRNALREELGIKTKYVLGHIGRFAVPKNHSFILDVFAEVLKRNDDCTLVLVGNGELENQIKQKAKDMGLNEKIVFVDFKEDIYRYYSLFDLFLMPSLFEAFPITLVEAQANGLRAIVSDTVTEKCNVAGLIEFFSLEKGSAAWAEKIIEILENTSRLNVLKEIEACGFSLNQQIRIIVDLYFN